MAIDISGDFLAKTVSRLESAFPGTACLPVVADFTEDFALPAGIPARRRAAFFPGSTFGNLDDIDGRDFLSRVRRHVGPKGRALIGIDLRKDVDTLIAAYAGCTETSASGTPPTVSVVRSTCSPQSTARPAAYAAAAEGPHGRLPKRALPRHPDRNGMADEHPTFHGRS